MIRRGGPGGRDTPSGMTRELAEVACVDEAKCIADKAAPLLCLVSSGELVDRDAGEIGKHYALAKASIVESVEHLIDCGQRLKAKKASLGHGAWLPWLRENEGVLGFGVRTADRLMASSNWTLTSNLDTESALSISRQVWGNHQGGAAQLITQSNSVEWYTPEAYIESARSVLGVIDLDPASCEFSNRVVKAGEFYTLEDDGLSQDWRGRVWLNPPYGKACSAFVSKLCLAYENKEVEAAILLINSNSTDTGWFSPLWDQLLCFTNHRINFYHEGESVSDGSTQLLCIFWGRKGALRARVRKAWGRGSVI